MSIQTGIQNPFWDIAQKFPKSRWGDGLESYPNVQALMGNLDSAWLTGMDRNQLVRRFSWALSSPEALDFVAEHARQDGLVEMGAGTGYWAWQLTQRDVDVIAYDKTPTQNGGNEYHGEMVAGKSRPTPPWFPVMQGTPEMLRKHSDRALFLCWPPYSTDMADKSLKAYQGNTLIYIGEGEGGCCGDDTFFEYLESEWVAIDVCKSHVQWSGLHDRLFVYRRLSRFVNDSFAESS